MKKKRRGGSFLLLVCCLLLRRRCFLPFLITFRIHIRVGLTCLSCVSLPAFSARLWAPIFFRIRKVRPCAIGSLRNHSKVRLYRRLYCKDLRSRAGCVAFSSVANGVCFHPTPHDIPYDRGRSIGLDCVRLDMRPRDVVSCIKEGGTKYVNFGTCAMDAIHQ